MIERERWIIYPLLFFALLLAARDRIAPPDPLECGVVQCNELRVKTLDGKDLVRLGGSLDSGVVIVYGPQPTSPVVSLDEPANAHLLELGTSEGGGYVTAYGPQFVPTLRLGHYQPLGLSGLIAMKSSDQPEPADSPSDKSLWGATIRWPREDTPASVPTASAGGSEEASPASTPSP